MTITETATPTTDEVIAAMLTENTGTHFLDSGGTSGRAWQRNAGKDVDAFKAAPAVHLSTWERDGKTVVSHLSLDVFHFLSERVTFDAERDAAFREFANDPERSGDSWFENLEEWRTSDLAEGLTHRYGVNTYNGEDCLSQVLQYDAFDDEDGDPVLVLMVHGGADVRGGYSSPRFFTMSEEFDLCDNADFDVVLTEPEATPADLAQLSAFDEFPVPTGGRTLSVSYRGNAAEDVYSDDETLAAGFATWVPRGAKPVLPFGFEETAVIVADDGTMTIAEGDLAGWAVDFHPPCYHG